MDRKMSWLERFYLVALIVDMMRSIMAIRWLWAGTKESKLRTAKLKAEMAPKSRLEAYCRAWV